MEDSNRVAAASVAQFQRIGSVLKRHLMRCEISLAELRVIDLEKIREEVGYPCTFEQVSLMALAMIRIEKQKKSKRVAHAP